MSGMELWWLGQSGFRLRDSKNGAPIFIDPFLSDHAGRTWPSPVQPDDLAGAGAILVTHEHIDHFDKPAIKAANEIPGAGFMLVLPEPIVDQAEEIGIPRDRIILMQPDKEIDVAGARVTAVPACHGLHVSDAYSFGEKISNGLVRFLGYVVDLGGVRAYHAGDTIPYQGMAQKLKLLNVQLAMLPINGRGFFRETERDIVGNMEPREAARVAVEMGASALIPMHWDLFLHNRGFPGDLAAYVSQFATDLTLLIIGRNQKIVLGGDGNGLSQD